jgi:hypothetical protein
MPFARRVLTRSVDVSSYRPVHHLERVTALAFPSSLAPPTLDGSSASTTPPGMRFGLLHKFVAARAFARRGAKLALCGRGARGGHRCNVHRKRGIG